MLEGQPEDVGPKLSESVCAVENNGAEAMRCGDASGGSKYSLLRNRNVGVPASSARWVIELMAFEAEAVWACWRKMDGVNGVAFRWRVSQAGAELPPASDAESSTPIAGDGAGPGDVDKSVNGYALSVGVGAKPVRLRVLRSKSGG